MKKHRILSTLMALTLVASLQAAPASIALADDVAEQPIAQDVHPEGDELIAPSGDSLAQSATEAQAEDVAVPLEENSIVGEEAVSEADAAPVSEAVEEVQESSEEEGGAKVLDVEESDAIDSEEALAKAIADAPVGKQTRIEIAGSFTVEGKITVPAGADIVFASEDGAPYTVTMKKSLSVDSGAKITFDGNLTFDGAGESRIVDAAGAVVIKQGTLQNGKNGLVLASGAGSSVSMEGGLVTKAESTSDYYGVISVKDGGTFTMTGGTVSGFSSNGRSGGNVLLHNAGGSMSGGIIENGVYQGEYMTDGAGGLSVIAGSRDVTFEINGGTIRNNSGYLGGGVKAYGSSGYKATVVMNDGLITGNKASYGGGGVFAVYGGCFILNGGAIDANSGRYGGGVGVFDGWTSKGKAYNEANRAELEAYSERFPAEFTMNGGSVANNTSGHVGGGIYVASDKVTINGGTIAGNRSSSQGGGIYVACSPYRLNMKNASIHDNTASLLGGGMWYCPTGEAEIVVNSGTIIYNNTASGSAWGSAGDDFVTTSQYGGYLTTIPDYMLGGGAANWHWDGSLNNSFSEMGQGPGDGARYDANSTENVPVSNVVQSKLNYALKAVPSADTIAAGEALAQVQIYNNSSARGGGIGSNGGVVLGDVYEGTSAMHVKKVWEIPEGEEVAIPESVTVQLVSADGAVQYEAVLSADNEWSAGFNNLPAGYSYDVVEVVPEGWEGKVSVGEPYETEESAVIAGTTVVTKVTHVDVTITNSIPAKPEEEEVVEEDHPDKPVVEEEEVVEEKHPDTPAEEPKAPEKTTTPVKASTPQASTPAAKGTAKTADGATAGVLGGLVALIAAGAVGMARSRKRS